MFAKHKRIQKFRVAFDLKYIYKNESDKGCFACNGAYSDNKYLAKITLGKVLKED